MAWLLDHLQIAVLVLLGIGSLFKSIMESAAKTRQEMENPPPPAGDLSQDTNYRKPAPSVPPPLARAQASARPPPPPGEVPPAARLAGYEIETANEQAKVLKHQAEIAERLKLIREYHAQTTGGAAVTRSISDATRAKKPSLPGASSLHSQLRDPAQVRRAFILSEILEAPVGLRSSQAASSGVPRE